jgi:hypothetical protein
MPICHDGASAKADGMTSGREKYRFYAKAEKPGSRKDAKTAKKSTVILFPSSRLGVLSESRLWRDERA